MSKEYWAIGAALVGALVGIIAPSPQQKREAATRRSGGQEERGVTTTATVTRRDRFESVYQPVLLIVALGVSLWVSSEIGNPESAAILRTLAAGSAGGLLGLLGLLGLMVPNPHSSTQ